MEITSLQYVSDVQNAGLLREITVPYLTESNSSTILHPSYFVINLGI
jgi:hypothetical protein